ncbi:MAG TPA: N-acetylmuramoyl-L-alanine amidase [Thermoanaerobaculales bacterium]|nr:N-acetylmuramoyl-L-alanine amidase [Thermoanaerobaculales bacterium]HPA81550.1 N-acetylmuramoyl-L-alanine amidase [Thermoanaerobaculales bacterium]HQL30750.1 N-acetylmuramoyl-L-alanine amidase [Thermoanaerobaculales bacterium]HQP43960.1 N-acetylmuramoyl-L-alanine amidase [Thermoanaerobaculales bacterium]
MKRRLVVTLALILWVGSAVAQERPSSGATVEFHFGDRSLTVPLLGSRLEILPVLAMVGAEASYAAAADTYGVVYQGHVIQFAIGRRYVLVDGSLHEAPDAPAASPGGVAASLAFLEQVLLAPIGFHLEPAPNGHRIVAGARVAEPVTVRPAAADFGLTTTLVLTLDRPVGADVKGAPDETVIRFADATPVLDNSLPFRSRRVVSLTSRGQELVVRTQSGVGVLNWHTLTEPDRVVLELGAVEPSAGAAPPEAFAERTGPRPIVIDPGHGGSDTGAASGSGIVEKEVVLAVARRLATILAGQGHTVRLTRPGDDVRALTDRTSLANRVDAVAFVSLHANASTVAAVQGAETYYMSLDDSSTDEHAAATAQLENRSGEDGGRSSLDLILWDLAQAEVLNESAELALAVQGRLNERLGLKDRGVKQAPFVVLTGATMPAILVEIGFLSNPAEAQQLASVDHQQRLAEALALGIDDFVRSR